jgi:hypothetical protein
MTDTGPSASILDGYHDEDQASREFRRSKQTLRSWRRLRKGPPWVKGPFGPLYPIAEGREWLRQNIIRARDKSAA